MKVLLHKLAYLPQNYLVCDVEGLAEHADLRGDCDDEEHTIRLDSELEGKERLEVEVHEALHAIYPYLDEEPVEQGGLLLSEMLWKMGYRKINEAAEPPG